MIKILYISYDGLTDPLGQSQILPYIQFLAKKGFHFTILSFEKKSRLQKEGKIIQSLADQSGIQWVPLPFTAQPPVFSKIYDRYRMFQTAKRLHKANKYALIHCRSYVAAEVGLELKRRFGVKMLFDMRGFWADEKIDNGQWNQKHYLYRRIYIHYKKKEKKFLQQADGIISLTAAGKEYLLKQSLYQQLSIDVIPCCADLEHFNFHTIEGRKVEQLRYSLGIKENEKIITYLGSVGGWYMTKEMFQFFKVLIKEQPIYKMLFLTKDDPEQVKKEASEAGIPPEKIIITYSDREQLPHYIALSSCSIFFIRNTFSKIASSPTKHAELMGMGIPVICNDIGDTGNIIRATGTAILLNEFDEASIEQAVKNVPELEKIDKELIRRYATEYFDLQNGGRKYFNVYTNILKSE